MRIMMILALIILVQGCAGILKPAPLSKNNFAWWLEKNAYYGEFSRNIGNYRYALLSYEIAIKSIEWDANGGKVNSDRLDTVIKANDPLPKLNQLKGEIYYGAGVCSLRTGNYGEAIVRFRQSLKYDFKLADIHKNLGIALYMDKQYDEAMIELLAARREYRTNSEYYQLLTEAEAEMYSTPLRDRNTDIGYYIGKVLLINGDLAGAIKMFEEELTYGPNINASLELNKLLSIQK